MLLLFIILINNNNMNNNVYSIKDVENLLKKLKGESIPVVFIDHLIIFYDSGDVREVDHEDIKYFFPNVTHTSTDMIKHYNGISEINIKVDLEKIKNYMNSLSKNIEHSIINSVKRHENRKFNKEDDEK